MVLRLKLKEGSEVWEVRSLKGLRTDHPRMARAKDAKALSDISRLGSRGELYKKEASFGYRSLINIRGDLLNITRREQDLFI